MKKKQSRDPIASFERETRAARRVGDGSKCKCGEKRPLALIPGSNPVICAECHRQKHGRSRLDGHHPAGKANNPLTVEIPANDHRAQLSPNQYDWPNETWENPEGSPLLAGAASIRGYSDTAEYLSNGLLIRQAELLEALDKTLKQMLPPKWWIGTPLERFAPKRSTERNRGPVAD